MSHKDIYGELMADISTSPDAQNFKYSGKELDQTYGLDLYDFHSRQYAPLLPGFNGQDKHAEKYYWLSPYAYCAGNPVNCIDPDGKDILDCVVGFAVGVGTDIIPGSGYLRDSYSPSDASDYNSGLQAADNVVATAGSCIAGDGLAKIGVGLLAAELGVAATAVTGGAGSELSVPVVAGGAAIIVEGALETAAGAIVMVNANENQSQGYDRGKKEDSVTKTHGKNESHGDGGRAMTKAEKKIEQYKLQLQNAANKKEREAIKVKIKNVTEDAKRKAKGENHSQGNKR